MRLFKLSNEEIIKQNEKLFKVYVYLPLIIAISTAVLFFIWSIVDPAVFNYSVLDSYDYYYGRSTYKTVYGVMGMNTFFGAMIVWWVIGAIVTVLNYCIYKLILAPTILRIFYLKKISLNSEELLNEKKDVVKEQVNN